MEFRQLKYFITLAEELHFGRAAERLHLSQPALSKQIQALEDDLEIQLFERTKHQVKLTSAGKYLLETAHRVLHDTEQGIQVAKKLTKGEIGLLRIGVTTPALYSIVPELLRKYRNRFPTVELALTGMSTEDQVEALRNRQIDVGFLSPPIREKTLALQVVYEEPYLVALPKSHPLANQEYVSLASLADEPIIFYPRSKGPSLHAQFVRLCGQAGFVPNIVQEVEMPHIRIGLVAAELGVTFIASSIQSLTMAGVIYKTLVDDFLKLQIALAWRQEEQFPGIREFISLAEKCAL